MTAKLQPECFIFYASQTGTAQEVAEHIGRLASNRCFRPIVAALDSVAIDTLPSCQHVIFVVSTTGDGEVPSNMKHTWSFLLRKHLSSSALDQVEFCILGLGDSSYAKFNSASRKLHKRLLQLGAKAMLPLCLGDDQHPRGYFTALDPWLETLWTILLDKFPLPRDYVVNDAPQAPPAHYHITYLKHEKVSQEMFPRQPQSGFYRPPPQTYAPGEGLVSAQCQVNTRLTHVDWTQDVRHLEFQLTRSNNSGTNVTYAPGDLAWIYPENQLDEVEKLMQRFQLDADQVIAIAPNKEGTTSLFPSAPLTIRNLFRQYLDILGTPRRYFFEQCSVFASNEEERAKLCEMISPDGADLLYDYCTREKRTYVEIFSDFPSICPPLEVLVQIIPLTRPRAFSISSHARGSIHLTVAIVDFITPWKRRRTGVCTSYIAQLEAGMTIPMWISQGMIELPPTLPKMILIGPGTGVAPMRSIIQYRMNTEETKKTDAALFFGCRHETKVRLNEARYILR